MSKPVMLSRGDLVEFMTKDRALLHGFLLRAKKSKICMVNVHGMTGNFYGWDFPYQISGGLAKLGISLFSINTRGHDLISRTRIKGRRKSLISGTAMERFEDSFLDIDAAINVLRGMGFKKFILCGHSTGCQKITYYQYRKSSRDVLGLILLAPADDYNARKKDLGRNFSKVVAKSKLLVKKKMGDTSSNGVPKKYFDYFSAKRFLSVADLKRTEARIFNYDGELREFSAVNVPVLAIFGSREEYAVKPVELYLNILRKKSRSRAYTSGVIKGARHSFRKHENELETAMLKWLKTIS